MKTGGRKSRGFESHPLRHALGLAAAALLIAGCSAFARTFDHTFAAVGDLEALPVVLRDQTGQVAALDEPPLDRQFGSDEGVFVVLDNPNALVLHWVGGMCDQGVSIDATGSRDVAFTLTTTTQPGACNGAEVPRSLLVVLTHPVDAGSTFFTTVH